MPKIAAYRKVTYATEQAANDAEAILQRVLELPLNGMRLSFDDPNRLVLWRDDFPGNEPSVLYLSPGAHEMLKMIAPGTPDGDLVRADTLPETRALMFGNDSDWDDTGSGRPKIGL